ncbi:hypothetical protein M3Y99_00298200 [Aphelenchoides fujianensis]|nr:hypothetical protein M3Y99_00298200 [Aphelenchoides fujianensis]
MARTKMVARKKVSVLKKRPAKHAPDAPSSPQAGTSASSEPKDDETEGNEEANKEALEIDRSDDEEMPEEKAEEPAKKKVKVEAVKPKASGKKKNEQKDPKEAAISPGGLVIRKNERDFTFVCEPTGFGPDDVQATHWRELLVVEARKSVHSVESSVLQSLRFECHLPPIVARRLLTAEWADGRVVVRAEEDVLPYGATDRYEVAIIEP